MDESVIQFKNVTKSFYLQEDKTFKEFLPNLILGKSWAKKFLALSNISFDIKRGETIGIVGKNGAGKSTLLKLIAEVTTPTTGQIIINGKVAPLIELGAGFHHELTGYENILLKNGESKGYRNIDTYRELKRKNNSFYIHSIEIRGSKNDVSYIIYIK